MKSIVQKRIDRLDHLVRHGVPSGLPVHVYWHCDKSPTYFSIHFTHDDRHVMYDAEDHEAWHVDELDNDLENVDPKFDRYLDIARDWAEGRGPVDLRGLPALLGSLTAQDLKIMNTGTC